MCVCVCVCVFLAEVFWALWDNCLQGFMAGHTFLLVMLIWNFAVLAKFNHIKYSSFSVNMVWIVYRHIKDPKIWWLVKVLFR